MIHGTPSSVYLSKIRGFFRKHWNAFSYMVYCKKHGVVLFSKVCGYSRPPTHVNGHAVWGEGTYEEISMNNGSCCSRTKNLVVVYSR